MKTQCLSLGLTLHYHCRVNFDLALILGKMKEKTFSSFQNLYQYKRTLKHNVAHIITLIKLPYKSIFITIILTKPHFVTSKLIILRANLLFCRLFRPPSLILTTSKNHIFINHLLVLKVTDRNVLLYLIKSFVHNFQDFNYLYLCQT